MIELTMKTKTVASTTGSRRDIGDTMDSISFHEKSLSGIDPGGISRTSPLAGMGGGIVILSQYREWISTFRDPNGTEPSATGRG
jgi:hypothetical protein